VHGVHPLRQDWGLEEKVDQGDSGCAVSFIRLSVVPLVKSCSDATTCKMLK
jgi:hypothetical protein